MEQDLSLLRARFLELAVREAGRSPVSETRFRSLVEQAPFALFHLDLVDGWIYRNIEQVRLLGGLAQQPLGPDALNMGRVHPDDHARLEQAVVVAMDHDTPLEIEVRCITPAGDTLWLLERAVPERDQGRTVGWFGILLDITERKRLEERARRESLIIQHITEALGTASSDHFFDLLCNHLASALEADLAFINEYVATPRIHLRTVAGDVHGRPLRPVCYLPTPEEAAELRRLPGFVPMASATIARMGSPSVMLPGMRDCFIVPLRDSGGRLLGFMGVMHSQPLDAELAQRLISVFARRVAVDLERTRSQRVLVEQRENLSWISNLAVRLHGCNDLDTVAGEAVAAIASHPGRPQATLILFEQECELPMRVLASTWGARLGSTRYPRTAPVFEALYHSGGVLVIADVEGAFPDVPEFGIGYGQFGIVEQILILLHHGRRELGLLAIDFTEHGRVSRFDVEGLHVLGRTLSLAISHALHTADLEYRASHDFLTGLFSRNVLHAAFAEQMGGRPTTLLLLDLDRFKEVNDALGHAVGDRLLQQIGPRLAAVQSERSQLLCRMGGDEFALLLPGLDDEEEARTLAQTLMAALQRPFEIDGMRLQIGASVGIARYPSHGSDSHELLRSADVAMYAAKQRGGGVAVYDPALDRHTPQRLALLGDLAGAIRNGQLVLHYQPKMELGSGRVAGFEALVRWQHPTYGLLYPDSFLPLAEMGDGIHLLTAEVLRLACADLARWHRHGESFCVAVNLSARNLVDDQCLLQLQELLARHQLPAGTLELEITETALMHDPHRAAILLQRIAALGVTLAIDDYGTGYSSLAYLRRLPIRLLKIDRTFVSDMVSNHQDTVIVQSTIQLAHNLGLKVLAEGVENAPALHMLRGMGCDLAQGYHISRPLPRDQVEAWLQRSRGGWTASEPGA